MTPATLAVKPLPIGNWASRTKPIVDAALNAAQLAGATYADVRVVRTKRETIVVKNGTVGELDRGNDVGVGVRVIAEGGWGFASTYDLTEQGMVDCAKLAVRIARASSRALGAPVRLA
ncbi:MAG: TldD/PmbA family protein, partial [Cyanobacteria bacterium REEB65]|nr:TldD/PmbA family protein [Cyanobacteria bacterium REEB65]